MKTFKEFCEQAYNPFGANKPENPVKKFARGLVNKVQSGIQNKLRAAANAVTDVPLALGIHVDPQANYIQRQGATQDARMRLKGINPENPDRMNTNMQFKTHQKFPKPIDYSVRYAAPKPPKTGFGGRPTTEA